MNDCVTRLQTTSTPMFLREHQSLGRNAVPGTRFFRCDECNHHWDDNIRDCLTPSGEHCERCGDFVHPYFFQKQMVVMIHNRFTPELCQEHQQKLFVFGDNLQRKGKRGQAAIRDEQNAFGIATKIAPLMSPPAFFGNDDTYLPDVIKDIRLIYDTYHAPWSRYTAVVFPAQGLGTGLARLPETSPTMWSSLCQLLHHFFGYNNGQNQTSSLPAQSTQWA